MLLFFIIYLIIVGEIRNFIEYNHNTSNTSKNKNLTKLKSIYKTANEISDIFT